MKIKYLKKPMDSELRTYIYQMMTSNTPFSVGETIKKFTNPKTNKPYTRDAVYYYIRKFGGGEE